jgi:ribulose-5-phosphate 4-epimerase/fuculose-1-phosphate aldolase
LSVDHIKSTFNALRRNKETGAIIWEEQVLLKVPDMVKKEQKTVELEHLIEISRYYGNDPDFVIAGGGNTSYKDDTRIWIKASGIPLAGISEKEFVCLSREKLGRIGSALYNEDPFTREQEVKRDLNEAIISPQNLRPSVETSLHNLIGYSYVVHTHPTLVNGLMCSNRARDEVEARFGAEALYVEYTDPGFSLFKKVQERIAIYQGQHGTVPRIIFLQNHGVFVGADTIAEIRSLYESIDRKIHHGGEISWPCAILSLSNRKPPGPLETISWKGEWLPGQYGANWWTISLKALTGTFLYPGRWHPILLSTVNQITSFSGGDWIRILPLPHVRSLKRPMAITRR